MTPRMYCARDHSQPFWKTRSLPNQLPYWRKVGKGLIGLVSPYSGKILPLQIWGVEFNKDGKPVIKNYWGTAPDGVEATRRAKSVITVREWATKGQLKAYDREYTYEEWKKDCEWWNDFCPNPVPIPDEATFWKEYGFIYKDGKLENPFHLNNKETYGSGGKAT